MRDDGRRDRDGVLGETTSLHATLNPGNHERPPTRRKPEAGIRESPGMALTEPELRRGFRLGVCLVEPNRDRIVRPDGEAHLEPKVMEVLVCLAENAGEVVSREVIFERVWADSVVTEQAITNCISDLRHHLGDDRSTPRYIETVPKRGYRLIAPVRPPTGDDSRDSRWPPAGRRWPVGVAALVLAGASAFGLWWALQGGQPAAPTSVAVMPFENAAGNENLDYLRLALPDEITTLLTKSRELVVRSFEHGATGDPLGAARERNAEHVVTGHYYLEDGDRLAVAVEAQQVEQERLVWRARITVPAADLVALRETIAERVSQGLLPSLGVATDPRFGPSPEDDQAYQLYLRSLALPRHPEPTVQAIEMLEQAVELDPNFAQAWHALGLRRYEHGTYGSGSARDRQDALVAYKTALELDPALIPAAVGMIALRTEAGELEAAYREASRLIERHENNAQAHFALAYVYRFGGMLEASQRHCEIALDRDPHNPSWRSCAYAYLYAGELDRVRRFLDLDQGSYFVHWGIVLLELRRGNDAAALDEALRVSPDLPTRRFMEPCLKGQRGEALAGPATEFIRFWGTSEEPEAHYALAPMLAYCGRRDDALDFLERAVAKGFCSYPALDQDPIWEDMRDESRFREIREAAIACHENFRAAVGNPL